MTQSDTYLTTRQRVERYFDRQATQTWARLTSDAPVSGIRATVRAGRDQMRNTLLAALPDDLMGWRILDAGCGTGTLAFDLAHRGADVVAVDLSPALINIAESRCPEPLRGRIQFASGDLTDPRWGRFDHAIAMDSLIYYDRRDLGQTLSTLGERCGKVAFTVAPRTPLLMLMWRVGQMFPKSQKSPTMVPHSVARLQAQMHHDEITGQLREIDRVTSGFYISTAVEFQP
ncbi:magnesium protoporphyrin IX methyltransferase [Phaeobacter sp.]|uniref:magnesium protoporphyrin IX methyltransferase n=1 Tax=Phaeobacter sp. TaxID=1902409 RepID=UPI0025F87589|nr:magnesium protoporphyrin IX methyltransferase [Phaeobacter sp.]